jgi:abequosyltransferase
MITLSICIATYNRANFIGQTLESILPQLQPGVELLVVDGASPDATPAVMAELLLTHPGIRYFREPVNSGVDADYDKAVGYARGDYCWLMTDDDILKPGAVARVMQNLPGRELIVANGQVMTADLSRVIVDSLLRVTADTEFSIDDPDSLLAQTAGALSFIGSVIVKRSFWLSRDRRSYDGSLFVHVGVIFQSTVPAAALAIADPLILVRYGNAMWTPRGFEIWMFKWPTLVWSFAGVSERAKAAVIAREPWRQFRKLLLYRAIGGYSGVEYRRYLAIRTAGRGAALLALALPPAVANIAASLYCLAFARTARMNIYDLARSRHAGWVSRAVARLVGV